MQELSPFYKWEYWESEGLKSITLTVVWQESGIKLHFVWFQSLCPGLNVSSCLFLTLSFCRFLLFLILSFSKPPPEKAFTIDIWVCVNLDRCVTIPGRISFYGPLPVIKRKVSFHWRGWGHYSGSRDAFSENYSKNNVILAWGLALLITIATRTTIIIAMIPTTIGMACASVEWAVLFVSIIAFSPHHNP